MYPKIEKGTRQLQFATGGWHHDQSAGGATEQDTNQYAAFKSEKCIYPEKREVSCSWLFKARCL